MGDSVVREPSGAGAPAGAGAGDRDGKPVISSLQAAIRRKTAKIGVIGLGYVGLPLIRTFVAAGFQTLGFDVDPHKIEKLLAGQSYIEHIPARVD